MSSYPKAETFAKVVMAGLKIIYVPGVDKGYLKAFKVHNLKMASDLYRLWLHQYQQDNEPFKMFLQNSIKMKGVHRLALVRSFIEYYDAFKGRC